MSTADVRRASSSEVSGSTPGSRSGLEPSIIEIGGEWLAAFWAEARQIIATLPKAEAQWERTFVSQAGIYEYWGSRNWVRADYQPNTWGQPRSIHIARFTRGRSHDAWGRYITFHLGYTLPGHRFLGHGLALVKHVEQVAADEGYDRIRSTIQSWGGLRLHLAAGHRFWGKNEKNELVVDSALLGRDDLFPYGIPKRARKYSTYEMSTAELIEHAVNVYEVPLGIALDAISKHRPEGVFP
jgi:GNAT superfamily N-acetyltransferase